MVNKTINYWVDYVDRVGKTLGGDYSDYEMVAIQVLDGEWDNFGERELEKAFVRFLKNKAEELGAECVFEE